jgi:uncharacterized LabA/DUF88 family protein
LKAVVILIDFDNYFGSDVSKLSIQKMELSFKEMIRLCESEFSDFNSVQIRLYGGWYKETIFTKVASEVQQILSQVNVFPKTTSKGNLNGSIELATSLYIKPEFVWGYTYKETQGVKRIRINHECVDDLCKANRTTCPKYLLYKFTESKERKCGVVGCENLQKDVFKGAEQKMVDTLIACDIITTSEDETVIGVLVISDDQDLLPSLALASMKKKETIQSIILGIQNKNIEEFFSKFMEPFNIKTKLVL